jgi:phosphoglycerate dehydrogenase-like enzyme
VKLLLSTTSYSPNDDLAALAGIETFIARSVAEAVEMAVDMDAAVGFHQPEFVEAAPKLRWIQMLSTGINNLPFELVRQRGIIVTNAGSYGPNMADHVMAFMLMLSRKIPQILRLQAKDKWARPDTVPDPGELSGQTLLIVGLGGIGIETAKRAAAFGMRVVATKRQVDGAAPDFVDEVHPAEALHDLLPSADWINVSVPFTTATQGLIGDREFDLMRRGVHILCLARGGIIDTAALLRALDSGKVAGAGLDVTDPEPLPDDHPLWDYPNVVITPHVSGYATTAHRRLRDVIVDNAERFLRGEPLRNTVDLEHRY